jgi:hypothetical protein
MRRVNDQYSVEDLAAYAAHPALHDRVHARRLSSGTHDPDAFSAEYLIKQRSELAVPITNHELERVGAEYSAALCDLGVFMDQPTESISSDDLDVGVDRVG